MQISLSIVVYCGSHCNSQSIVITQSNTKELISEMTAPASEVPEIADWLNNEFFQEALESDYPGIRVHSTRVEPAVAIGENFVCIVYRAIVSREVGTDLSLIIKVLPASSFKAQMVRDGEFTLREVRMYKETFNLLGESCNRPKCFYAKLDNVRDAVVLEDLRPKGYKTRDRKLGLDFVHSKLVMEQLGKLHGSGIALRISHPDMFDQEIKYKYPDTMYSNRDKNSPFIVMVKITMEMLADAVKKHLPERFHALAETMMDMKDYTVDMLHEAVELPCDPEELDKTVFTLNHGDLWSNNILFNGDESSPLDCALIDFQISRAVPAVIDLLYFLNSSTDQELRKNYMDELLHIYWSAARAMLNNKGVANPGRYFYESVEDIKIEMNKFALPGFLLGCFIMPIVMAKTDNAPNLENLKSPKLEESSSIRNIFSGPIFCSRFRGLLEDAENSGVFESKAWQKFKPQGSV